MDHGLWTTDHGRWTMDHGRWTMDDGRWTMDDGRWTMDHSSPPVRRVRLDDEGERALLPRCDRADADHLPRDLLAPIVADRDHHRVLPWLATARRTNRALDAQRRQGRDRGGAFGARLEPEVLAARRTDARALENDGAAVRADPRGTGHRTRDRAHDTWRA